MLRTRIPRGRGMRRFKFDSLTRRELEMIGTSRRGGVSGSRRAGSRRRRYRGVARSTSPGVAARPKTFVEQMKAHRAW
jgi:hypothetical protein